MNQFQNFSHLSSVEDISVLLREQSSTVLLVLLQQTVELSVNYYNDLLENCSLIKCPVYFIEFELCRDYLLSLFHALKVDFSQFGFPMLFMYCGRSKNFLYVRAGAISYESINELALLISEFSQPRVF